MSVDGTFQTCRPAPRCPFTGVDRKSSADGENEAIDPNRTFSVSSISSNSPAGMVGRVHALGARMKRREFLGVLGSAASWPLAAFAQQPTGLPTIGFMGAGTKLGWSRWTAAFVQRMMELGWLEGKTVIINYQWAEGSTSRYEEIAALFAQLKVSAIVTVGGEAAKQATSSIPIVAALTGDPVGQGLAASMSRPGGNFTGMSIQSTD